jgi:hypothetical protein
MEIKQIKLNKKFKLSKKHKLIILATALIMLVGFTYSIVRAVNNWFATHTLQFNKVITIQLQKPIEIKERIVPAERVIEIVKELPEYENLTDIEKYICDKWGVYDCKVALAIAKAESGMREDAYNAYNSNNTIDIGIFQINSVHYSKDGCGLKDVVDAKKNIDCAYKIWEASGWEAWSAYNSGSFKSKL